MYRILNNVFIILKSKNLIFMLKLDQDMIMYHAYHDLCQETMID